MKKWLIVVISSSILMMTAVTAGAYERRWDDDGDRHRIHQEHNRNWFHHHRYGNEREWRNTHHGDYEAERNLPFKWRDHYDVMRHHYPMERIYDGEWVHRFPGVHGRRWHGNNGFWHHGRYVTDAVFFFNDDNRLVSIGYMADGVFIHFREDSDCYENRESFFVSWWSR